MPHRPGQPELHLAIVGDDAWTQVAVDLPTMLASVQEMLDVASDGEPPELLRFRDRLLDAKSRFWWRRRSATWRLSAELAQLLDRNPSLKTAYGRANRRLVARQLPPKLGASLLVEDGSAPPESGR